MKKIKLLTYFIFSIMLLFCLTACKKGLSAPTITSDGLTVSWNKVDGAEQYLIYDTNNNTFIAETTDLSYTFSDIVEDINIYVKSSIKKGDEYKISARSNVVTIAIPVLDSPILTSSKYTVQWTSIKYADYYKIFNAENDIELVKTKDLSYQFDHTEAYDLKVYVIAYYEHELLEHKKSNKSNSVTINPTYNFDYSTIDVSKTEGSDFIISDDITSICFTGNAKSSWNISVQNRTTKLDITFDNLNVSSSNGSVLTAFNNDYELNLHIKGNCSVRSSNAAAIVAHKINIDGAFHSTLEVLAGNGKDGSAGTHGSTGSYEGGQAGNGGNGTDGKKGYDAFQVNILNISDVHLTCIGGNGGNGGDGAKPGSRGRGGSTGSNGTGSSVNGIGLGINYGQVYYDGGNNPTAGKDGTDGNAL